MREELYHKIQAQPGKRFISRLTVQEKLICWAYFFNKAQSKYTLLSEPREDETRFYMTIQNNYDSTAVMVAVYLKEAGFIVSSDMQLNIEVQYSGLDLTSNIFKTDPSYHLFRHLLQHLCDGKCDGLQFRALIELEDRMRDARDGFMGPLIQKEVPINLWPDKTRVSKGRSARTQGA